MAGVVGIRKRRRKGPSSFRNPLDDTIAPRLCPAPSFGDAFYDPFREELPLDIQSHTDDEKEGGRTAT
jgi:hypothetical protein